MKIKVFDEEGKKIHDLYVNPGTEAWDRCGVSFNPSGSSDIDHVKRLSAGVMQRLITGEYCAEIEEDKEAQRCFRIAANHLEAAQMFAVKGIARLERSQPPLRESGT